MEKAKDTLALAEESYVKPCQASTIFFVLLYNYLIHFVFVLGVAVSEADFEQWIEEEKVCILIKLSPLSSNDSLQYLPVLSLSESYILGAVEWKLKCVLSLSSYYCLRFALTMIIL